MNHREAYALMLYRSESTGREEWLWNSRDGVTPFIISDAEDGSKMRHADFWRDVCAPFYVPPIGSRIFVDLTETRARAIAVRWYDHVKDDDSFKSHPYYEGKSREWCVDDYVKQIFKNEGEPDILVVNAGIQDAFRARRPVRQPPTSSGRFA